jgi:hypothetical protein
MMSQRRLLSLFCLSLLFLLVVQLTRAGGDLRVNESRTRFVLHKDRAEVLLAVENTTGETRKATVKLELLNRWNAVLSETTGTQSVPSGPQTLQFNLPPVVANFTEADRRDLLWYRLRYRLVETARANMSIQNGIISLSEIMPDMFEIRIATSETARAGGRYKARVQAVHPFTRKPANGVQLSGEISFDDDENLKPKASAVTDKDGYAVLSFLLPQKLKDDNGDVHVTATRGGVVAEAEGEVPVDNNVRTLITSDKLLYQPGQTMHVRALMLNSLKRAVANENIVIRIVDPERTNVFVETARSSRFGVVNADWQIPDNVRLGDYRISVDREDGMNETGYDVRISRYELPNFTVIAEPDRLFYQPEQNAKVKVRADYLFGQPVKRGHVRVVEESSREWNFREQKWDIDEGEEYEGDTDDQGVFLANVDLESEHEGFSKTDYNQFRDQTYAAYFTDPTTNRTEQRRFSLRLTKDAIHVYIIRTTGNSGKDRNLPLEVYVSTFNADGSPARCKVDLELSADEDVVKKTVRTNAYGLAKINLPYPADLKNLTSLDLKAVATDAKGRSGTADRDLSIDEDDGIRVDTEKTLYRAGEPIVASISSSLSDQTLVVELVKDSSIVRSERVRLRDGRATATFPYAPNLTDRITVAAYPDFTRKDELIGVRTILYPTNPELNLNVKTSQASYQPGENARVSFNVRTSDGQAAESVLGVVVSDKAVEERMRADQEFGQNSQPYSYTLDEFLGLDEQLSGVTLRDLRRLDMSKPVSPALDLLAELLLNRYRYYYPVFFDSHQYDTELPLVFGSLINSQLQPARDALYSRYVQTLAYPSDEKMLRQFLREAKINFEDLYDPWGVNYRPVFSIDRKMDVLALLSAGADKRFDTDDDFSVVRLSWEYFVPLGQKIQRTVEQYHKRTKAFIRDRETLRQELVRENVLLDHLRDRWGQPYRFEFVVEQSNYVLKVTSSGPDRKFATTVYEPGDDFLIFQAPIDYFAEQRQNIEKTLSEKLTSTGRFPQSANELSAALRDSAQPFEPLRDPWERPYYAIFKTDSFYADRVQIENRAVLGSEATQQTKITPVTRTVASVTIKSPGSDGVEGTADDFSVGTFAQVISETPRAASQTEKTTPPPIVLSSTSGAIHGAIIDPQGARVPGVVIKATQSSGVHPYETQSDDNGEYVLKDLPPGTYEVRFEARGFTATVITNVVVRVSSFTQVNITLQPGTVSEVVTVSGVTNNFLLESSVVGDSIRKQRVQIVTKSGAGAPISTPRLREYFPETLVWQPSVETDARGRAEIKFKLADNITTWKMAVIGSTEDGRIGTAETEFKAFQPFFVEHDPPRVLTEGDEISLPVVVRNYLNRLQKVDLEIKTENWFTLTGPARKQTSVEAGDAARQTFDFRAVGSVENGRQRITALGSDANDAIEKPVTVHPDGEERSVTSGDLLGSSAALELNVPESAIGNSTHAELKIYPNLMAHVVESVEAIMARPYGCGEQTISSAYPSLLVLRNYKQSGTESSVRVRAERYLKSGYTRLLNYRDESGGFAYWSDATPDVALTAYAIRFLTDAADVMELDHDVITEARSWLIQQQKSDGSWSPHDFGMDDPFDRRRAVLTAYVARIIAATESIPSSVPNDASATAERAAVMAALQRAMEYVGRRSKEIDEPYLLASYALALLDLHDTARAKPVIDKLRSLAQTEGIGAFWALETNTPFYGWGLAGRVETTALVVQALHRYCRAEEGNCGGNDELIKRGLLFLFKQKDRYGVWYSTQATINVLDTMLTLFRTNTTGRAADAGATAAIEINGRVAQTITIPEGRGPLSPIIVPITSFMTAGKNRIEIKRSSVGAFSSVQGLASYYVPWSEKPAGGSSPDLRLQATFDKTDARIGSSITCHVEAERIGFRGYGMLLAEIGLPPGADVDRSSLETALKNWTIMQYDVLPDRILLYLWPRAGVIKVDFQFRPRFGLAAKTAPSVIYDYYNPESRVVVQPVKFLVK